MTCDEIHLIKNGEFIKTVKTEDFSKLEAEMKEITIAKKLEKLELI